MTNPTNSSQRNPVMMSKKAPHRLGQVGYGIVIAAFIIAVVNSQLAEPNRVVGSLLLPLIFVGIGGLLYHIGQHLHALHLNVIRMAMMEDHSPSTEAD